MSSPFFPLDVLKQLMMESLTEAVTKGAAHIRDPVGGSNETLFVYVILFIYLFIYLFHQSTSRIRT